MLNKKISQLDNVIVCSLQLGSEFNNQHLTQREIEVLRLVVLGYTAKKIGQQLNISYRTAEAYINTLKEKLNCCSKGELASIAFATGLIHRLGIL